MGLRQGRWRHSIGDQTPPLSRTQSSCTPHSHPHRAIPNPKPTERGVHGLPMTSFPPILPSAAATASKRPRTMSSSSPQPSPPPPPTIHLTAHETQLFDLLKQAVAQAGHGTVLRVAGGWVRDKLLGRESDDIDMALDNVSGTAFAEALNAFLQAQGLETRSIGVIQANPDQSKHLETARVLILGHWVDFTNLRTETYRADSRIPDMAFGTAPEDAFRRDFTLNALFYNLQTGQVEDHTGKGLEDLLGPHGTIRTPLPALTTFLDDPLRLLRAIRFSARFALPLDADIVAAAKDAELTQALHEKVSRERVGIEVEGMLSGKDARPALALDLLVSLGLADVVFFLPPGVAELVRPEAVPERWSEVGLATVRLANVVLMHREDPGSVPADEDGTETLRQRAAYKQPRREHRLLFLAAMLRAWAGYHVVDERKAKDKKAPVVQWFIREALKLRAKDADDVALLLGALDRLQALTQGGTAALQATRRLEAGLLLREVKDLWRVGLDLACARELAMATAEEDTKPTTTTSRLVEGLERYQATRTALEAMGLDQIWTLRPLLDGKAIITSLQVPKGPLVGQVMAAQIEWQLEHPQGDEAALRAHLQGLLAAGAFVDDGTRPGNSNNQTGKG